MLLPSRALFSPLYSTASKVCHHRPLSEQESWQIRYFTQIGRCGIRLARRRVALDTLRGRNIMHMSKLAIGTALALIIAVAIGRAEGATSAFEGTLSSTGISVEMDTNGDGLQGGVLTGIMDGPAVTGGSQFDFQSYIEFSPPRLSANCPLGAGELPLLLNRFVLSQRSTGDQIV